MKTLAFSIIFVIVFIGICALIAKLTDSSK